MYIHKEGRNTLLIFAALLLGSLIFAFYVPTLLIIRALIPVPAFVLFLLILWFFRVPKRTPEIGDNLIIAPADGKIVVIEKTLEEEYLHEERIQISIFMSPLNVHQNTYPIDGEVTYTKYHTGKYLVAWHPKSSTLNERSTIVVKHKTGTEILIRQIAGAVARRICTYSTVGDVAKQSTELGFIKFGSRVDVFLPTTAKVLCNVDQVTKNKKTVLAQL